MPDPDRPTGLSLGSYSLERVPTAPEAAGLEATPAPGEGLIRIILKGGGFAMRAMDPKIRIGDMEVRHFTIQPDESTIIAYVEEMPEEGAVISIEFEPWVRAEMPERFSRAVLQEPPPAPPEPPKKED